jgi:hypothetical protein
MSSVIIPNQQTRQQLEELDALLQRMLELPTSAGEEHQPTRSMDNSVSVAVPLPPGNQAIMSAPISNPVVARQNTLPSNPTQPHNPFQPQALTPTMPAPVAVSSAGTLTILPLPELNSSNPIPQTTKTIQTRNRPPISAWAFPFVVTNMLYDGPTYLLGPIGRKLRSAEFGRYLGWAGIGMGLLAIGWTVALRQGLEWNLP